MNNEEDEDEEDDEDNEDNEDEEDEEGVIWGLKQEGDEVDELLFSVSHLFSSGSSIGGSFSAFLLILWLTALRFLRGIFDCLFEI